MWNTNVMRLENVLFNAEQDTKSDCDVLVVCYSKFVGCMSHIPLGTGKQRTFGKLKPFLNPPTHNDV